MEACAARKCQPWVCLQMIQLQCSMGCHEYHAILCNSNRFLFSETRGNFRYLVVPLKNFASMSNCPLVQGKSYKPPPPHHLPRCMCGGGK